MDDHSVLQGALDGLTSYESSHRGGWFPLFCGTFSQAGIAFPQLGGLGPGLLAPRATLATHELARPLLEWVLLEEGVEIPVQRQQLESRPWLVSEHVRIPWRTGWLHVRGEHAFEDPRTLRCRFELAWQGAEPLSLAMRWRGRVGRDDARGLAAYFHGTSDVPRTVNARAVGCSIVGVLADDGAPDGLPGAAFRIRCVDPRILPTANGPWYAFAPQQPWELPAGSVSTVEFRVEIALWQPGEPMPEWPEWACVTAFDACVARARAAFSQAIAIDRPPRVESPALLLRAWRARHALLRSGVVGLGGEFGDAIACLCTSDNSDFSCVFFWDALFSSVALARFHPEYARGAIRAAFVRTDERDGSTPERKFNYSARGRMAQQAPQSPVASWAVRCLFEETGDLGFVDEMYPRLVRMHDFWEQYSDTDRDGLAEYRWTGQVSDDSPIWDAYAALDRQSGCGWVPPVASVALNCFLVWDARHLAHLAEALGRPPEASGHRERAGRIERALLDVCFVPQENRFWDYNHHTRMHTRVRTWHMFWPLFAGISMPEEARRALLDALLDSRQFFGDVPFPSVAYDEPKHDPLGYWRGRVWPHITYWLLETLVRAGEVEAADEAARRWLCAVGRAPGFPENLPSDPALAYLAGFPDYNWGAAAFLMIASGDYRRPLALD